LLVVFEEENVARVFGIPCKDLSVADNYGKPKNEKLLSSKGSFYVRSDGCGFFFTKSSFLLPGCGLYQGQIV
jgi:hypothetical protein